MAAARRPVFPQARSGFERITRNPERALAVSPLFDLRTDRRGSSLGSGRARVEIHAQMAAVTVSMRRPLEKTQPRFTTPDAGAAFSPLPRRLSRRRAFGLLP